MESCYEGFGTRSPVVLPFPVGSDVLKPQLHGTLTHTLSPRPPYPGYSDEPALSKSLHLLQEVELY